MLEKIQEEWASIALQTSWKLEPLLSYVDNPDESKECDNEPAAKFGLTAENNGDKSDNFENNGNSSTIIFLEASTAPFLLLNQTLV